MVQRQDNSQQGQSSACERIRQWTRCASEWVPETVHIRPNSLPIARGNHHVDLIPDTDPGFAADDLDALLLADRGGILRGQDPASSGSDCGSLDSSASGIETAPAMTALTNAVKPQLPHTTGTAGMIGSTP